MSEPPPRYVEPIATRLRERPAKPPAVDLAGHDAQEGTCHKCGGLMLRGRPDDARLCGKCGTRYHASDCGKRLHTCGLMKKAEMCPKVRVTARAARRSTRGRSLPNESQFARGFLPPPHIRALTERRRAHPSQCHGLCSCSGGLIRCHVTVMRVSRLSRSRDEAEGAVFDGDGGVALDDDSPIEGNGVAIGGSNARAGGEGNARNGAKIGELSPQPTDTPRTRPRPTSRSIRTPSRPWDFSCPTPRAGRRPVRPTDCRHDRCRLRARPKLTVSKTTQRRFSRMSRRRNSTTTHRRNSRLGRAMPRE
jgi:hypothetical protein